MSLAAKITNDWEQLVKDISEAITKLTGNVMEAKQRPMVESRLKRRCLDLRISDPNEYRNYWKQHQEEENKILIGLLTTHFTSFFREFAHFEWLASELPSLVSNARKEGRDCLKIWSAAASKGQEVWSLCMWMEHHMPKIDPTMKWTVMGSDIDEASIKEADNGVYHRRELETAPRHLWESHWVRGKAEISDWYKVKPSLKAHAEFRTMNLLDLTLKKDELFDVIVCRNVLIYFDNKNQEKIVLSLLKYLRPNGTLITGLSESLGGYGLPIRGVSPSVYKRQEATVMELPKKSIPTTEAIPSPLKVLCVDDSATILSILKKILRPPQFEIIGTAKSGLDAIEQLKTLRPDVITLDIHMPEMDGPTFLQTSGVASRIPVIVVSSVGREHSSLIEPMKNLGVMDFVEKPSLTNVDQIGEELSQKLKMSWLNRKNISVTNTRQVVREEKRPHGAIIFNFGSGDELKVQKILNEHDWDKDHIIFKFNGPSFPESFKERIQLALRKAEKVDYTLARESTYTAKTSVMWLGFSSGDYQQMRLKRRNSEFMVVEENAPQGVKSEASDISPTTSFNYLINKFFRGE